MHYTSGTEHDRFPVFLEIYRFDSRNGGFDPRKRLDEPKRYPGDNSPWAIVNNYCKYFGVTAEYVKWEVSYINFLMDLNECEPAVRQEILLQMTFYLPQLLHFVSYPP